MSLTQRLRTRLRLTAMGPKAIGEFYRPILSSLHVSGAEIQTSVPPVLQALGLESAPAETAPPTASINRAFPDLYDSDPLTREALWRIVRALRPAVVVETGVANGLSSQTILRALDENEFGTLYSFDIDARAEQSVPDELRARWVFNLLEPHTARKELERSVRGLSGAVGLWFHDSDHNYSWQRDEYQLASSVLAPKGVLASDDADGTEAFADFCVANPEWRKSALFDVRKVCGFARKP